MAYAVYKLKLWPTYAHVYDNNGLIHYTPTMAIADGNGAMAAAMVIRCHGWGIESMGASIRS